MESSRVIINIISALRWGPDHPCWGLFWENHRLDVHYPLLN